MFEAILQQIEAHDVIILHRHSKPDGDALGSQIGMKHLIRENYPQKTVYAVGDEARFYGFMEDSVMDSIPDDTYKTALAIILDTSAKHLISDERYMNAAETARIDHHIFCGQLANHEVVDTSFESCCGLVTQMAQECGWKVSSLAAKSLYTGMVTDSGRFRYDCTSANTFRNAAFLMAQGFDVNEIFRPLYADNLENKKLKARFIQKIQLTANNVAYIKTTLEEFSQYQTDVFTVSRGMVNTMADITGVSIWVNFTETEEGVLCEIRSAGPNINPIAVKYGGGGHAKASGALLKNRGEAMAMLSDLDALTEESK